MVARVKKAARVPIALTVAISVVALVIAIGIIFFKEHSDSVVISPNVIVYDEESSPFKILASNDDSIIVTSMDGISEDSIISVGVTDKTPSGLLRKVVSSEPVDGGFIIATAPAALTEAIEKCDVHVTVSMEEDGSYAIEELGKLSASNPFVQQAFAGETLANLFSIEEEEYSASLGNMIEVELKINFGDIRMRVVDHFQAKLSLNSLNGAFEKSLFDKPLKPFTFMVGPVPVVFTNNLEVTLNANASSSMLGFDGEASVDKKIGFEYSTKRGLTPVHEDESKKPKLSFKPEDEFFRMSLNGALTGTLGSYLYGYAGPELSLSLEAESSACLHKMQDGETSAEPITMPGTAWNLGGQFSAKVCLPMSGTIVLKIPANPFDKSHDPLELANATIFDTEDLITLVDIEKQTALAKNGTHVETEYFSLEVPESWGGDFTFEDRSLSAGNRVWWLTPNKLDPFLPEQSDSRGYFGNYITIFVLGKGNGNGDMGGLSDPYGAKFQTQKNFFPEETSTGVHGGIIYPNQAEVFFRTFNRESPDGYVIGSPSQQQVDDAAYIVSTLTLK